MGTNKEIISNRQAICMMSLFIAGSTLLLGFGSSSKQDTWLAFLFGCAFAIPAFAIYARILSLFPGQNLYEILEVLFGRIAGKLFSLLYVWYSFHLGSLVLRNFQEFIKVVALIETPAMISVMFMGVLCIWVAKEGIEVLGRYSQFMVPILAATILIIVALSMTLADFDNLLPVLYDGFRPVLSDAFSAFSFPLAETVLFMAVLPLDRKKNNPYKIFYLSLAAAGTLVLLVTLRNALVLGPNHLGHYYFASYTTVSLVKIGRFLQRIEVTVAVTFLFAGFVKISVCLLGASKGIASIFKLKDYRQIVTPTGLLMMVTSCFIYQSIMEMIEWALKIYKFYAFPFQAIFPVLFWIVAEIKAGKQKKTRSLSHVRSTQ
jgi:spore germination protein KB